MRTSIQQKSKELLSKWVDLMNKHDAVQLAALYHEDATNLQLALGTPLVGRDAIRKDFEDFFADVPDSYTHVENMFSDGDWVAVEWTGGGLYEPTGSTFILKGCWIFNVIDGRIKTQRGYWDKHTWFSQVSLLVD